MNEDLPGRVDNTTLPTYKPLLPLFDAVINSIHAIEDRRPLKAGAGSITITVHRDQAQAQLPATTPEIADEPVRGFEVVDDGIGFNDPNLESFNTADSQYKKARGSKGVGRFLWLKAFRHIHISSTFRDDAGSLRQREFDFRLPKGIDNEVAQVVEVAPDWKATATGTALTLDDFQRPYKDHCPKGLDVIADRIIDHCLVFLVRPDAPRVLLKDDQNAVQINDRLRDHHAPALVPPEAFKVKGHDLVVQHFHVKAKAAKPKVHYVANQREVVSEAPADPDLNQRLPEADGSSNFALVSYVSGQLLDQHLNQERTGFTLPSRNDAVLADDVTIEDLREAANAKILAHALPFVSPLQDLKMQQITDAIHSQFPQYRPLLTRHVDALKRIPPGLSPDKLEVELHKIRARLTVETKENVKTFLTVTDHKDYAARFEEVMTKLNDVGKAALIENVVHRKLVLEILSKHLQRRAAGEAGYYLEEDIHRVIFPMRTTSDEVPFEDQNLWVIDEKLSYHRYLASDKKLKELTHLSSDAEDRPDIVIWNTPFALTDDPGSSPYASVVVLEFKRPQRGSYPESEESPNDQVIRYVRKIQEDKASDRTGRPIRVSDSTPFYAYILADLTPALTASLIDAGFIETPDRNGYYFYVQGRRTWIEVSSYDKVVNDAKKRNRNLFEALGLPTA
jgi:hypothetical protein